MWKAFYFKICPLIVTLLLPHVSKLVHSFSCGNKTFPIVTHFLAIKLCNEILDSDIDNSYRKLLFTLHFSASLFHAFTQSLFWHWKHWISPSSQSFGCDANLNRSMNILHRSWIYKERYIIWRRSPECFKIMFCSINSAAVQYKFCFVDNFHAYYKLTKSNFSNCVEQRKYFKSWGMKDTLT